MPMGKEMGRLRLYHLLLLIPLVSLWVPFYDRSAPALGGVPFFYWYQMAWIPMAVLITLVVYRLDRRRGNGP